MTDSVPCARPGCDRPVHLDGEHARLEVEFRGTGRRPETFVAHVECVDDLDEPEP